MTRTSWLLLYAVFGVSFPTLDSASNAQDRATQNTTNYVAAVERQPLEASINRVVQALQIAGSPLDEDVLSRLMRSRSIMMT